jgi:3',5'-cyclic AMP phosphodiesterase CpdA
VRKIAHLSDFHFGEDEPLVTEDLVESVRAEKPDLVVLSGDFTQRATRAQFEAARDFVQRLPEPKLVIPGNHDMPLWNIVARIFWPFAHYNRYIEPLGVAGQSYRDEEMAVIGLNTARRFTGKNGRISKEQVDRVEEFLRDLGENVTRILVTHHPVGQVANEVFVDLAFGARLALPEVVGAGVQMLLSGHHHRCLSGTIEETEDEEQALIVYAGTANSTRTREGDGNTYNVITIEGHDIGVRVMRWVPGAGFREGRTSCYRHGDDGWELMPASEERRAAE